VSGRECSKQDTACGTTYSWPSTAAGLYLSGASAPGMTVECSRRCYQPRRRLSSAQWPDYMRASYRNSAARLSAACAVVCPGGGVSIDTSQECGCGHRSVAEGSQTRTTLH
jgi:hypothetical protein